jgi:pilus assembly protein CpaC
MAIHNLHHGARFVLALPALVVGFALAAFAQEPAPGPLPIATQMIKNDLLQTLLPYGVPTPGQGGPRPQGGEDAQQAGPQGAGPPGAEPSGSAGSDDKNPLVFPMAEPFTLGPDSTVRELKDVYFDRADLIGGARKPERGSMVYKGVGRKLGTVHVTLVGVNDKMKQFTIKIVPNLDFIKEKLKRQFPRAALKLTAAGDNLLLVEGEVDAPGEMDAIIKFLDAFVGRGGRILNGIQVIGVQQVQLEVCIAQVDRTALRNMGFNYLQSSVNSFSGSQIGNLIGPPSINVRGDALTGGSRVFTNFNSTVNGTTNSVLGGQPSFFFGITPPGSAFLGFLELLRQEQLAKILATPTLVTLNGRAADFLVGGEQPFSTVVGSGLGAVPNVDFKPFGTRLTFLPVLLGDGRIRLEVIPEVSRPVTNSFVVAGSIAVPAFETQRIRATVELQNGQTLALGGLLQAVENVVVSKVPVLGDIPCVGAAFRRVSHEREELELLVLVTPRLVEPLTPCQRPTCLPGQETRPPTDEELFLKGMPEAPQTPTPLDKLIHGPQMYPKVHAPEAHPATPTTPDAHPDMPLMPVLPPAPTPIMPGMPGKEPEPLQHPRTLRPESPTTSLPAPSVPPAVLPVETQAPGPSGGM